MPRSALDYCQDFSGFVVLEQVQERTDEGVSGAHRDEDSAILSLS
jgi:hypothetical protein